MTGHPTAEPYTQQTALYGDQANTRYFRCNAPDWNRSSQPPRAYRTPFTAGPSRTHPQYEIPILHSRPNDDSNLWMNILPYVRSKGLTDLWAAKRWFKSGQSILQVTRPFRHLQKSSPWPGEQAPLAFGCPARRRAEREKTVTEEIINRQTAAESTSAVPSGQKGITAGERGR